MLSTKKKEVITTSYVGDADSWGIIRLTITATRAPTVMDDENKKLKSVGMEFTISAGNKETQSVDRNAENYI